VGSPSGTCHPTQVNIPHLNPSQTGRYSIHLEDGRLSWFRWPVAYQDDRRSPIQVLIWQCMGHWLGVKFATCWLQVRHPNHYATIIYFYCSLLHMTQPNISFATCASDSNSRHTAPHILTCRLLALDGKTIYSVQAYQLPLGSFIALKSTTVYCVFCGVQVGIRERVWSSCDWCCTESLPS